ncbi:MAG: hypothetical protein K0S78_3728 [Thermomicrobiales bacterium]|jgi:bifunctional DNA-binding transcriptional regulator/antitoxin component of YhaV-PrlF toxin-antitoxin module|nr:hypothetical protein [Thermomicrobiales bacterium]
MQTKEQTKTLVRLVRADEVGIPQEFREALGIDDTTKVFLFAVNGELRIIPVRSDQDATEKGSPWLRALYEYYAPVREEILRRGISEEEVNADIDAAIAAARAERRAQRQ